MFEDAKLTSIDTIKYVKYIYNQKSNNHVVNCQIKKNPNNTNNTPKDTCNGIGKGANITHCSTKTYLNNKENRSCDLPIMDTKNKAIANIHQHYQGKHNTCN